MQKNPQAAVVFADETYMNPIGLIAAMPEESAALLRLVKGAKPAAVGALPAKTFDLYGQPCLLVTSGMGARRAAEAARLLAQRSPPQAAPRLLISFGIAGAVEADLRIGDVVTAGAVCQLEHNAPGPLHALAAWPEPAREAAAQALARHGARLLAGTAVTTGGSQVREGQLAGLVHPILEMETAGITRVAAEHGLPCYALRAISDGPIAPIPFDLGEMMDADANLRTGRLLREMLRHPRIVLQLRRMLQNSRLAAGNAALALAAALSQQ
jgi:nucleoside phosphorylase